MVLNCLLYVSCWLAEGASEEPGDEGADGSDEEPSVGRQRYVDTEEMTLYLLKFFFFLRERGVSLLKTSPTQRLITCRWRGECWIFSLRWLTTPLLVLCDWDTTSWRAAAISFGSYGDCPLTAIDENHNNVVTNPSPLHEAVVFICHSVFHHLCVKIYTWYSV